MSLKYKNNTYYWISNKKKVVWTLWLLPSLPSIKQLTNSCKTRTKVKILIFGIKKVIEKYLESRKEDLKSAVT